MAGLLILLRNQEGWAQARPGYFITLEGDTVRTMIALAPLLATQGELTTAQLRPNAAPRRLTVADCRGYASGADTFERRSIGPIHRFFKVAVRAPGETLYLAEEGPLHEMLIQATGQSPFDPLTSAAYRNRTRGTALDTPVPIIMSDNGQILALNPFDRTGAESALRTWMSPFVPKTARPSGRPGQPLPIEFLVDTYREYAQNRAEQERRADEAYRAAPGF